MTRDYDDDVADGGYDGDDGDDDKDDNDDDDEFSFVLLLFLLAPSLASCCASAYSSVLALSLSLAAAASTPRRVTCRSSSEDRSRDPRFEASHLSDTRIKLAEGFGGVPYEKCTLSTSFLNSVGRAGFRT